MTITNGVFYSVLISRQAPGAEGFINVVSVTLKLRRADARVILPSQLMKLRLRDAGHVTEARRCQARGRGRGRSAAELTPTLTRPTRLTEPDGRLKQRPGPLAAGPGGRLGGALRGPTPPPCRRGQRRRSRRAPRDDPGEEQQPTVPRQDGARQPFGGGAVGSYSQHASLARLGPGPGVVRPACLGGRQTAGRGGCEVTGRPTDSPPVEPLPPLPLQARAGVAGPAAGPERLSPHGTRDRTGGQGGPGPECGAEREGRARRTSQAGRLGVRRTRSRRR